MAIADKIDVLYTQERSGIKNTIDILHAIKRQNDLLEESLEVSQETNADNKKDRLQQQNNRIKEREEKIEQNNRFDRLLNFLILQNRHKVSEKNMVRAQKGGILKWLFITWGLTDLVLSVRDIFKFIQGKFTQFVQWLKKTRPFLYVSEQFDRLNKAVRESKFIKGLKDFTTNGLKMLGKVFTAITNLPLLKTLKEFSIKRIGKSANTIQKFFQLLRDGLGKIGQFITKVGKFISESRILRFILRPLSTLISFLGKIFVIPGLIYSSIVGFIKGFKEGGIIRGLWMAIVEPIDFMLGWMIEIPLWVTGWILKKFGMEDLGEKLQKWDLGTFIDEMTLGIINWFSTGFGNMLDSIGDTLNNAGKWFRDTAQLLEDFLLGGGIDKWAEDFMYYFVSGQFGEDMELILEGLGIWFEDLWKDFKDYMMYAMDILLPKVLKWIGDAGAWLMNAIYEGTIATFKFLVDIIAASWKGWSAFAVGLWENLLAPLLKIGKSILFFIGEKLWISLKYLAMVAIPNTIVWLLEMLFVELPKFLIDGITWLLDMTSAWIELKWTEFTESDIFKDIKDGVADIWDTISNFFTDIGKWIGEKASSILPDWAKKIIGIGEETAMVKTKGATEPELEIGKAKRTLSELKNANFGTDRQKRLLEKLQADIEEGSTEQKLKAADTLKRLREQARDAKEAQQVTAASSTTNNVITTSAPTVNNNNGGMNKDTLNASTRAFTPAATPYGF